MGILGLLCYSSNKYILFESDKKKKNLLFKFFTNKVDIAWRLQLCINYHYNYLIQTINK